MARNDVIFSEISIKPTSDSEYVNILDNFQSSSTFGGMSISEGLFDGGISGFVILNDPNPNNDVGGLPSISSLAKTGSMIRFSFGTQLNESNVSGSINGLEFYVYNVSIVSDISPGIAKLGSSQSATYRLEFASYESTSIDYETRELTEDYVNTISEFVGSLTRSDETGILAPTPDEETFPANMTQTEPEIVETYNGLWLKSSQSLYPWGKEKSIPSINTIIRSSLNYAIPTTGKTVGDDEEVESAAPISTNPSYVFYQSLPDGQWHLIPIGGNSSGDTFNSLYKKNYINGEENAGYHTYRFTMNETTTKRIETFKLIKSTDILELQESGAFGSRYNLIEPNYRGLYNGITVDSGDDSDEARVHSDEIIGAKNNTYYHDAMSVATHLKQDHVSYKYEDFNPTDDDEDSDSPLLGKQIPVGKENPAFASLVDPVYGYFDTSYLYKPFPTINDDYATARGNKYMWQPMFDMCNFPVFTNKKTGEVGIKTIVDIRNKYKQAKISYAVLSDLKEQWNRYKHSICCTNAGGGDFLALLVGTTWAGTPGPTGPDASGLLPIDRNIVPYGLSAGSTVGNMFRYSFVEVEAWPKVLVNESLYGDENGVTLQGSTNDTLYFEYLESIDLNPANGQKKVYISGNSGDDYSDGGKGNGVTFTFGLNPTSDSEQEFKINQEQEMYVIPVNGGRRGLFTAYNTMELTNNKAFANAGINTKGFNYPSGYSLMPIGGMTAGSSSGEGTTPIPATYMGSIVNMTAVNSEDLNEIVSSEKVEGITYEGPDDFDKDRDEGDGVTYLLNKIMGSKNLPTTFAGPPSVLAYPSADEAEVIQRDDRNTRNDITDNAAPQPRSGPTDNPVVYMFTAENDHDGKCTS